MPPKRTRGYQHNAQFTTTLIVSSISLIELQVLQSPRWCGPLMSELSRQPIPSPRVLYTVTRGAIRCYGWFEQDERVLTAQEMVSGLGGEACIRGPLPQLRRPIRPPPWRKTPIASAPASLDDSDAPWPHSRAEPPAPKGVHRRCDGFFLAASIPPPSSLSLRNGGFTRVYHGVTGGTGRHLGGVLIPGQCHLYIPDSCAS
jgi:hypothetical protein